MANGDDSLIKSYTQYHKAGSMTRIYGDGVNPDAVNVLLQFAASGKTDTISFLDFGCGYGRYLALAEYLGERGFNVEYVAYDPFVQALQQCEENLIDRKFTRTGGEDLRTEFDVMPKDMSYLGPVYENGNVKVKLLHGEFHVNPEKICELIGEKDISMCMLGTLSHIASRDERVEVIRMFNEMSRLGVVLELPNMDVAWKTEQETYRRLAEEVGISANGSASMDSPIYGLSDPGTDIYYTRDNGRGGQINIFLHLYNQQTLADELKEAGVADRAIITGTTATKKLPIGDFAANIQRQQAKEAPDFMVILPQNYVQIQLDAPIVPVRGRI